MNGAKRPQMLLTPKEEMAGELRHTTGAQTSLTVDVLNGRSIVRTDQHMLAPVTAPSGGQGKVYC